MRGTPLLAGLVLLASALSGPARADAAVSERAQALHDRILVLDTHLDTPAFLARPGWDIMQRHAHDEDGSQVDYPRMVEGGLDGGFWVIYTAQGPRTEDANRRARDFGLERLMLIREMVAAHPDQFELATLPEDAARIQAAGKRSVYISIENAYPLSTDPSLLTAYHALGVRMLGLVHTAHNDFADSSSVEEPEWGGLSPAGRALVAEANRLGILIDQSHASDAVFDELLELSSAPIVLSHTGTDAIYEHPRNIDDARIRRLAEHGGVIFVNSFPGYLIPMQRTPEHQEQRRALVEEAGGWRNLTPEQYRELSVAMRELDDRHGIEQADFDDFMRHLLHILEVAGPDHVGIGADWDGGGGVDGLEDVALLPRITQALLDAGYTDQQIENIWGGNLLRVMQAAQDLAEPTEEA